MAKTKQTAKKSTGGIAKRRLIQAPTRTLRSHAPLSRAPSRSPQPTGDIEMAEGPDLSKPIAEVEPLGYNKAGAIGGNKGDDVSFYRCRSPEISSNWRLY